MWIIAQQRWDENEGYTMTDKSFVCEIIEDENGELMIQFPDDLIQQLGWREGDIIDWDIDENGRVTARKAKIDGPVGP